MYFKNGLVVIVYCCIILDQVNIVFKVEFASIAIQNIFTKEIKQTKQLINIEPA